MTARRARVSGIVAVAAAILAGAASPRALAADDTGTTRLRKDVVFTDYTPLSANAELIRRMLSPLAAAQIPAVEARTGLLVFIAPWDGASLPAVWVPVLYQFGLILVEPVRAGNDQSLFGRRFPLAILAEY